MEQLDFGSRIAHLERSLRRTQRVAVAALGALGVFLFVAAQAPQGPQDLSVKKLTAKEIEVGTDTMKTRILGGEILVQKATRGSATPDLTAISPGAVQLEKPGDDATCTLLPNTLAMSQGAFAAILSVSSAIAEAGLSLQGPARPRAQEQEKAPLGEKSTPRLAEVRAAIGFRGERGAFVELRDSMDRLRAALGAQLLKERGEPRRMPESTLTLWAESGECQTRLPAPR